jgi:type III secretory pathway component EscS
MMYLLSNYAGWLIAALLVGALVSLFTCRGRGPCPGWIVALAAFVVGLIVALAQTCCRGGPVCCSTPRSCSPPPI